MPIKFVTNFALPYCNTCHALQGLSISEPVTIFDTNHAYTDRRWVYTALTRAVNYDNVTIYVHSYEETKKLEIAKLYQYLNLKIKGYMEQDKKCQRSYKKEDYITSNWILYIKQFSIDECIKCNSRYYFHYKDGHIHSNLSVDRKNCKIAHTRNNCHLLCTHCNVLKNKY